MDDTLYTGFGPVSYMSNMLFGRAVSVLYVHRKATLQKLVRYCVEKKYSPHDLTFDEVTELQKIHILDQSEDVNEEARSVILSLAYLTKEGAVKLRKDA